MRKFIASVTLILALGAIASADEILGVVTKFEDGKITFSDAKSAFTNKGEKAETTTLKVADNVKILKAKVTFDGGLNVETEGDYEGGKDAFAKAVKDAAAKKKTDDKKSDEKKDDAKKGAGKGIGKKGGGFAGGGLFGGGTFAQIVTDGEGDNAKVTEIRVITLNLKKGPN